MFSEHTATQVYQVYQLIRLLNDKLVTLAYVLNYVGNFGSVEKDFLFFRETPSITCSLAC